MTTGTAMQMRLELAMLVKRHGMAPRRFTPLPLKPVTDRECSIQGLASPSTVDRERMKFSSLCWRPFSKQIPVLYRHQKDRVVGKLLDIEARYGGLFVRALVTDAEAKRCPYFSIAATIHKYELRQVDDPTAAHALITSATLEEVSLVPDNPGNPDAVLEPTPAAIEFYNLAIRGVELIRRQVEILQQTMSAPAPTAEPRASMARAALVRRPPVEPHRQSPFGALVAQIERNHHEPVQEGSRA